MKFDLRSMASRVVSAEAAPPVKIFDNIGIVGSSGTSAIVVETDAGLILIDCLWPGKVFEDIIEKGMRELGYDPADIKAILITHGHPDHTGCGKHFIDAYGAVPYMSKVDYQFCIDFCKAANNPRWYFDFEVTNFIEGGDTFTLGSTSIQVFSTPGHTPGGLSFILPVYDQGRPHVAALWGGSAPPATREACLQYLESLKYFKGESVKAGVDAEFSNHPILDNGMERMAVMANRIDQVANPFVIGTEAFLRYTDIFRIMTEDALKNLP